MKGQRAKLTGVERRRRAERNERRGRQRAHTEARIHREPVLHYAYRGLLVRVIGPRLEVVRIWNGAVRAHVPARPPKGTARLPIRHRRRIRKEADEIRRRDRMEGMGVELPDTGVWQPPVIATGAAP